jgi:2-haloacid dehalogenase
MLDFSRFDVMSFDCYGTLIDWERGIVEAVQPVLARHTISMSDDEVLEMYGELEAAAEGSSYQPYRVILTQVMEGVGERLGLTWTDEERLTLANSVGNWPPFPDSVAALAKLAERFKLVILSNIDDELFALSATHLKAPFTKVITAQQVGSYKPNVRNFEHMLTELETMGIARERVLHVAQSLFHDHAPAKSIGMTTVWINRRHDRPGFGATPPADAQPDLEVPDLKTLAEMSVGR